MLHQRVKKVMLPRLMIYIASVMLVIVLLMATMKAQTMMQK
jgi:hypothetical protein